MANSVDPDEMGHHVQSHLDLRYLQKPIINAYGSERVKTTVNVSIRVLLNYYVNRL